MLNFSLDTFFDFIFSPLTVSSEKNNDFRYPSIQGVPGGMCQTSGGCSLC